MGGEDQKRTSLAVINTRSFNSNSCVRIKEGHRNRGKALGDGSHFPSLSSSKSI